MADSIQIATRKINSKHQDLKSKGTDLGSSTSPIRPVGFGGYSQSFKNGKIYSHHTVGTFEVHGGILKKYISRREFDSNTIVKRRELGFPISDEKKTEEGFPASHFEWGSIFYLPGTNGGVVLSGKIYKSWKSTNKKTYGYPICSNFIQNGSEVVIFERGIALVTSSSSLPIWIRMSYPLLGSPEIVNTTLSDLPLELSLDDTILSNMGGIEKINKSISGRLSIRNVKSKSRVYPLKIVGSKISNSFFGRKKATLQLGIQGIPIKQRMDKSPYLFDFVCKSETGNLFNISPHCIYSRQNWENFGLIHATDIHVSKRIDSFDSKLKAAQVKYPEFSQKIQLGIDALNNWNNGFRDLIRYANSLYKKGIVDGIIATGDLVDYLFEHGDNENAGGNFKFFRDLILGFSKYPDGSKQQEELLVPIFTSLGNHDYRVIPYEIYQRVDIPLWFDKDIKQYSSFNLSKFEARIIQGGNPNKFKDDDQGRLKISSSRAKNQVIPVTELKFWKTDRLLFYKTYINRNQNTIVKLGKHKILMFDTGGDLGSPKGNWDDSVQIILTAMGFGNSDENAFQVHHAPNSKGPNNLAYNHLKNIKSSDGIIIVGMHAPPINTFSNEYPHYFRETEHANSNELETVNFIRRHRFSLFTIPQPGNPHNRLTVINEISRLIAKKKFPNWFTKTNAFKYGSPKELIDFGVSRGQIGTFLKLLCGQGNEKPIDLLLCGHDHTGSEIRVKWNSNKSRLEYYSDFYSENPVRFHNSRKYKGQNGAYDKVKIAIKPNAKVNQAVTTSKENGVNVKYLEIPPYKNPLDEATNKTKWWEDHKPLLIQGAPLGPTEHTNRLRKLPTPSQPSNEGCKLIIIRNNKIDLITQIKRRDLKKVKFSIPTNVKPVKFGGLSQFGGFQGGVAKVDRIIK